MNNLSVDDILDEIRASSKKEAAKPELPSMDSVNEIINGILSRKQNEELDREQRTLSLRQKKELDDEIMHQTKTLTAQFEQLRNQLQSQIETERPHSNIIRVASDTASLQIKPVQKNQQTKYRDTANLQLSQEIKMHKQRRLLEVEKLASAAVMQQDIEEIAEHFETAQIPKVNTSPTPAKPIVRPDGYKEFKDNRSKKVDSFVLDPKKPPAPKTDAEEMLKSVMSKPAAKTDVQQEQQIPPNPLEEPIIIKPSAMEDEFYEFKEYSSAGEVMSSLTESKRTNFVCMVVLGIIALISLPFLFVSPQDEMLVVANFLTLSPRTFSYINLALILCSTGIGYHIIVNALHSISEHKADSDILYSVIMALSLGFIGIFCLYPEQLLTPGVRLYVPLLVLMLFVNHIAKHLSFSRIINNFVFVSDEKAEKASTSFVSPEKTAINMATGLSDVDTPMFVKANKVNFLDNFLQNAFEPTLADDMSSKMLNFGLLGAVIIFVAALLLTKSVFIGISCAFAAMLIATGFLTSLLTALPIYDAQGVVSHFAGAMPDYTAIDTYQDINGALLEGGDFLTADSISLHGIKTFQGKRIDEAIIDAASILTAANSSLRHTFMEIISGNRELLRPVDSVVYEDSMGISGWVDQCRVLIGNRELMINHSIAVPKAEYELKYTCDGQRLIYVAIGGELCAAFIIRIKTSYEVRDLINVMYKNGISPIIKTVDFFLTAAELERLYDIEPGFIKILPSRLHRDFDDLVKPRDRGSAMLCNNQSLFGFVVSLAVCKRMFPTIKIGMIVHMTSAFCGMAIILFSLFLNTASIIGGFEILIFLAFFTIIYWLYEKNMKL